MVISADDSYIQSLLSAVTNFLGHQNAPVAKAPARSVPGSYQSPIKSKYYNSGNYSPGQATDARHPKGHQGVDLRAPGGTAIYSIAPGVVTNVGPDPKGGNTINIQHANGVRSYYAHLGTIRVHKGDRVNNGTMIATIGDSGNAKNTMPHLHIQVWQNGAIQDPGRYFTVPQFTNMDVRKEKAWLSENAKQIAHNFNINNHVTRMASSADEILKFASEYEALCIK